MFVLITAYNRRRRNGTMKETSPEKYLLITDD